MSSLGLRFEPLSSPRGSEAGPATGVHMLTEGPSWPGPASGYTVRDLQSRSKQPLTFTPCAWPSPSCPPLQGISAGPGPRTWCLWWTAHAVCGPWSSRR